MTTMTSISSETFLERMKEVFPLIVPEYPDQISERWFKQTMRQFLIEELGRLCPPSSGSDRPVCMRALQSEMYSAHSYDELIQLIGNALIHRGLARHAFV